MKFDVIEVSALGGAIVPVTKSSQATVKKWAKKAGIPIRHVKTIPGFAGTYIDTEAMRVNAWDFVDKYEGRTVRKNPVRKASTKRKAVGRATAPKRKATTKKRVTAKKCACKVVARKKGQRLPWVIGVLNGQQKGYFTGDGFDTNPSAALLFVSEAHAKRIAKQIRGLPRGAKLFITKKPLGAVGAPIIQ